MVTRYTLHGRVWKLKQTVYTPSLPTRALFCKYLPITLSLSRSRTCALTSSFFSFLFLILLSHPPHQPPLLSSSKGWKTDTSGEYFPGNLAAPYTSFSGQLCQFGARFESRVYHICDRDAATPAASVVYESFKDCQVFVELRSQVACEG